MTSWLQQQYNHLQLLWLVSVSEVAIIGLQMWHLLFPLFSLLGPRQKATVACPASRQQRARPLRSRVAMTDAAIHLDRVNMQQELTGSFHTACQSCLPSVPPKLAINSPSPASPSAGPALAWWPVQPRGTVTHNHYNPPQLPSHHTHPSMPNNPLFIACTISGTMSLQSLSGLWTLQ